MWVVNTTVSIYIQQKDRLPKWYKADFSSTRHIQAAFVHVTQGSRGKELFNSPLTQSYSTEVYIYHRILSKFMNVGFLAGLLYLIPQNSDKVQYPDPDYNILC